MNDHTLLCENQQESWKPIPGYEGLYSISNLGRFRADISRNRHMAGLVKRGSPNADGYLRVTMTTNGKTEKQFVHRLVLLAFVGDLPEGCEVNHRNGVKTDNRLANLEYVDHRQNMQHAIEHDLWSPVTNIGISNPNAKLTPEKVRAMREEYARGGTSYPKIAAKYGVTHNAAMMAIKRQTWKHVTE